MFRLLTFVTITLIFIETIQVDLSDKICKPIDCQGKVQKCPYGYQIHNGCEICRCYDPCNPPGKAILCGSAKRCFVSKKPNGTFEGRCGSSRLKRSKEACAEPKVIGLCKAAFSRFYYNSSSKQCESFLYGGCNGNGNNFVKKSECETTCLA